MKRNARGQFTIGHDPVPVGTVRIRTRHKRNEEQRAYVKVAAPNRWRLRAHVVWESNHGPIPKGVDIHHIDGDKLNDSITNLQAVSRAEHLDLHRHDYQGRTTAKLVAKRKEKRWSTKSSTKRTGRPPTHDPILVNQAVAAYLNGEGTYVEVASRFGITEAVLSKRVRAQKQ